MQRAVAARVHGVLCFVDGEVPLLGTLRVRGVYVVHARKLAKLLAADGPHGPAERNALARRLAGRFPAA